MVINDKGLLELLSQKQICTGHRALGDDPYSASSPVQPASVDLVIGQIFLPCPPEENKTEPPKGREQYVLRAGETAIVTTSEEIVMPPTLVGICFLPSHVSVQGILTTNPGQIDPGYQGVLRFTVINMGKEDYVLRSGDTIVSIVVLELKSAVVKDWSARREGAKGDLTGLFCTSRCEREFTRRTAGNAKQEVQSGTDRDVAAPD